MISLALSRKLREAGLAWTPALHDFFVVPDRGMDERVFVLAELPANIENYLGSLVVAFQGASEWALDYLVTTEAVWMPTETQLRSAVEEHLLQGGTPGLRLTSEPGRYRLELTAASEPQAFEAPAAEEAYALALLYLLRHEQPPARFG